MTLRTLRGLRIAVYARFSSDRQRDASIEDQVRRCREHVERLGGAFDPDLVFADHAISGASLQRPAFEALMARVRDRHRSVDVIVTEDLSRVSRDFADAARVFKELEFLRVPLLGVADGIDTSARGAKLNYTLKSLIADVYLDDLRDKTLRGLEGRALAGFSTGGLPLGYRSEPVVGPHGETIGRRIVVDEERAPIVWRIFRDYADGRSIISIAAALNAEGVPPARAKTRHRRKGWVASTVRDMLHNAAYVGRWTFKRRAWVRVPGSGARRPRARDEAEVMHFERPELRLVDEALWDEVQARLALVRATYCGRATQSGPRASGKQNDYVLSGLLRCDACGASMIIAGGSSARYYRCGDAQKRRTCAQRASVREPELREAVFGAVARVLASPASIASVHDAIAARLGAGSDVPAREIASRRESLAQTRARIERITDLLADGENSAALRARLRALEAEARDELAAIDALEASVREQPEIPSAAAMHARALELDADLRGDPMRARERLRQVLDEGSLRLSCQPDGVWVARGALDAARVFLAPNGIRPDPGVTPSPAVYSYCCGGRI